MVLVRFILMMSIFVLPYVREIFPYLVVVIGLENVLVLTKSVVSTPVDLEVKLRIAQGKLLCACACFSNKVIVCTKHTFIRNEFQSHLKSLR